MNRLQLSEEEYDPYYHRYILKVPEDQNLLEALKTGASDTLDFFDGIPESKWDFRYAPAKWTIKEVLQHLIDTERIFVYRCFRIARKDGTPLAGFDQNIYMAPSGASQKSKESLLEEYRTQRANTLSILSSLREEQLAYLGEANNTKMSARAAAFTIAGHDLWHKQLICERYLNKGC